MLFVLASFAAVAALFVWTRQRQMKLGFVPLLLAALFAAIALTQALTVIPAGHVGVVDVFGKVSERTLKAGINLRNPFANIIKLSVKTQEIKEVLHVPSQEGLTVQLEVSILYHLDPDQAAEVYKTIGSNYVDVILVPQFRSVARGVTASYEAKALYTSEREVLARSIQESLGKTVAERGIVVETTPLRAIVLPQRLTQAIEQKLESEQESQRMQFILQKEKQEAERKRIEAQGISDFQKIVSQGISEQLLRWKGIEATEKLATSANAKVVLVGGKDGLPVILNAEK